MDTPKVVAPFTSVDAILEMLRPKLCRDALDTHKYLDCGMLECNKCVLESRADKTLQIQWVKDNMFKQGK